MYRQRLSGVSNSPPSMRSPPRNRTFHPYTDPVAGYQNQASGPNLERGYGWTPSPQQQLGQRVPDTQSQRADHLLATRRLTYAEVLQKQTPFANQYNSARPSGLGSILAENMQPWAPPRRGPGTVDVPSDQDPSSYERIFAMYTNGGNSEGAREPSPYHNSIASGSSVLPTPSGPVHGNLGNDDEPWSTVHQRGYENRMGLIRPHLPSMPQMDPSAFQDNHASEGTYLTSPDLYNLSHVQCFNKDIQSTIQPVQPTRTNSGYGQADYGVTKNTNHLRAPRQVPNQRASGGVNTHRVNTNPVARSGDGRSYGSPSTTSMHRDSLHCPHCDTKFTGNKYGKGNLARHIRHKHQDHPKISCGYCGELFQRTDARLKHHRKKHPELEPPTPNSQRSGQSSTQTRTGPTHDVHSNESRSFNGFEAFQDYFYYPGNMGQPEPHPDDLRGLTDS
ncbi:hypothetical protein COCMIDRAFT_89876 [Bipolaris oryzae ATCC 44560]|uniref:C2H2-type domain-containing protein n=1 Tax=Bipolaris oryzae ATCC 44560 TaxID=930090 RepID=W6ZJC9_COCMI|nr:uncharacterized protein COCMIDRAFT_89876 [Bipolaris oryzae ATCC 44560]EUC47579.1 hypothetical protein COCMIDRAFT_89876 [Bipolaris oryzae ATCC 44560]